MRLGEGDNGSRLFADVEAEVGDEDLGFFLDDGE